MAETEEEVVDYVSVDLNEIIAQQLEVIDAVSQLSDDLYDSISEDKVRIMSRAFIVIYKSQLKLLKQI